MKKNLLIELKYDDKVISTVKYKITEKTTPEQLLKFMEKVFKNISKKIQ